MNLDSLVFNSFSWGLISLLLIFLVHYFLHRYNTANNALYISGLNNTRHTNKLVAFLLIGLTGAIISSCSSDSSSTDTSPPIVEPCSTNNNGGWITVTNPENCPSQTEYNTELVMGEAFISSDWYRCCSGSATDTGVTVSWVNETTSESGDAFQRILYCWFLTYFLCHHTYIADIPLAMGDNRITITATDPDGVSGQRTITITRVPETTPPTVISTLPEDLSIDVAPNQQITASFSEEIDPVTVNNNTFTVSDSSGNQITGAVSYNAQTASFTPDTQLSYLTLYHATLSTAISDLSGNSLTSPYTWQFTTAVEPDTTPPTVVSTDPFNTETCVALDKDISVTFDEDMDTSTINNSSFILRNLSGISISGFVSTTNTSARFNPSMALSYGTGYQATLTTGIKDISGNAITVDYQWSFETIPNGIGTWVGMSTTNAPSGRYGHSAIWTGTEMIIWGGGWNDQQNTGGRYNPASNTWQTTSTQNAPSARGSHSAVWTGSEMIIWGGRDDYSSWTNTGGRYDPVTDSWQAVNLTGAPSKRSNHVAVWSGTEMIIWGGHNDTGLQLSGARYNPVDNNWATMSTANAPQTGFVAYEPSAVWTGQEMLIIDRVSVRAHRYNPTTDTWHELSRIGAPEYTYSVEAVTWTGTEMLVWGFGYFGAYNPVTDTWHQLVLQCTPSYRSQPTSVWTGNEMIIWGGKDGITQSNSGGYYHVNNSIWSQTSLINAPEARNMHTAVWTGDSMIIWGGQHGIDAGGIYTP